MEGVVGRVFCNCSQNTLGLTDRINQFIYEINEIIYSLTFHETVGCINAGVAVLRMCEYSSLIME